MTAPPLLDFDRMAFDTGVGADSCQTLRVVGKWEREFCPGFVRTGSRRIAIVGPVAASREQDRSDNDGEVEKSKRSGSMGGHVKDRL